MLPPIELIENEPFSCPADYLAEMAQVLGGYLERGRKGWLVRRLVGHISLRDGTQVIVRSPKASTLTVLSMLAYVDPTLQHLYHHEVRANMGDEGQIGNLLARLFCLELRKALGAHGVQRHYQRQQEQSEFIRGRLVFAGQPLRQHLGQQTCETWQRNPNTPLNRTFCAVLDKIRRDPVLRCNHEDLVHHLLLVFGGVPPVPDRGLVSGQQQLGRSQVQFCVSLRLGQLLLGSSGAEGGSQFAGLSFLLNLEALFENAVQKAFAAAEVTCRAGVPLPFSVMKNGTWKSRALEMDLYLPDVPLVVDAKFKSRVGDGNLHQMVTYCQMTGSRRAVLVFPKGMSGPTEFRFRIGEKTVQVSCVEFSLDGRSRAEWDAASAEMVEVVLGARAVS